MARARVSVLALLALGAGCKDRATGPADASTAAPKPPPTTTTPSADAAAADAGYPCASPVAADPVAQACHRWLCGRQDGLVQWTGSSASCAPGDVDAPSRARALGNVNVYRALAGLPALVDEPSWDGPAQSCALLAHANDAVTHDPAPTARCFSDAGALASSVSLVANKGAPEAIDPFVEDPGNEATMVHRRWLLSEARREIGIGSTDRYACVLVDGRPFGALEPTDAGAPAVAWASWPPAGIVPIDVFRDTRLDVSGWTVQSETLALDGAAVVVRSDAGEVLPVRVAPLEPLLGSAAAVRFVPDGWTTQAGRRYAVEVSRSGATVITYEVVPVACGP